MSSPNKLKICHTIKQLYADNTMPKHENNALQKKCNHQLKKVLFLSTRAWGTLDWSIKSLDWMHCIMFTWYPL